MKRTLALVALVAGCWAAAAVPAEPASACSIYCPEGYLDLELVEVRLVDLPQDASRGDLPVLAETASVNAWGSMWFDDGTYLYIESADEVTQ